MSLAGNNPKAAMPWEATTALTALGVVAVAIFLVMRIRTNIQRHIPTCSSTTSIILCLLAYAKFVGGFVCSVMRGKTKLMTHSGTEPHESSEFVMKLLVVELMLIPAAIWLTKASILATLYGVKNRAPPKRRHVLDIIGVVILSTWLVVTCTYTFACRPFNAQWSMDPKAFCSPILKIREQTILTVLDIFCNIVVIICCFTVFDIRLLPKRDRMSILYILFIVFLECAACLIRIAILAVSGVESMSSGTVNTVIFLSRVEIALGLMTASWPTLRGIIDTSLFCADVTMGSAGHSDFAKTVQQNSTPCGGFFSKFSGKGNNSRTRNSGPPMGMDDFELHFSKGRLSDEGNLMGLSSNSVGGKAYKEEMELGIMRVESVRIARPGSGETSNGTMTSAATAWSETMPARKQSR